MTEHADRTRRPFAIDEGMAILSRTPAALDALLRGLPDGWLAAHEGDGTWCPYDIVGHLIHGERTDWMARLRRILESGDALPFDRFDRAAQFEESKGRPLPSLLDEFAELRRENLRALESLRLTPADLERRGLHPELGPVTLGQLLATFSPDLSTVICFPCWTSVWLFTPVVGWGQPARGARQSRHCAATLGVWVPRHPSRRGTLPRYSLNAARPTSGRTARRGRLGRDGEAANSRRPGSAEPKHSSALERHVQLDDAPVARGATVLGPGSQAVRPDGSTRSAIEAGLVVRRHNARTGDWCSRPSCSRVCATHDS